MSLKMLAARQTAASALIPKDGKGLLVVAAGEALHPLTKDRTANEAIIHAKLSFIGSESTATSIRRRAWSTLRSMDRLAEVMEFRERLVSYMNLVLENRESAYSPLPERVMARLLAEQPGLSQTYGRLFRDIHPSGIPQRMAMGYGTIMTSADVIADAIHNPGDSSYNDLARIADQHLMMRIGQMQREAQERAEGRALLPEILIRITSVGFWLGRLWALIRWLVVTKGGRIAGLIGALLLAVVTALVTGWAQSLFAR